MLLLPLLPSLLLLPAEEEDTSLIPFGVAVWKPLLPLLLLPPPEFWLLGGVEQRWLLGNL